MQSLSSRGSAEGSRTQTTSSRSAPGSATSSPSSQSASRRTCVTLLSTDRVPRSDRPCSSTRRQGRSVWSRSAAATAAPSSRSSPRTRTPASSCTATTIRRRPSRWSRCASSLFCSALLLTPSIPEPRLFRPFPLHVRGLGPLVARGPAADRRARLGRRPHHDLRLQRAAPGRMGAGSAERAYCASSSSLSRFLRYEVLM